MGSEVKMDNRRYSHNLNSCEIKAWIKFRPKGDSNPWPLHRSRRSSIYRRKSICRLTETFLCHLNRISSAGDNRSPKYDVQSQVWMFSIVSPIDVFLFGSLPKSHYITGQVPQLDWRRVDLTWRSTLRGETLSVLINQGRYIRISGKGEKTPLCRSNVMPFTCQYVWFNEQKIDQPASWYSFSIC